MDLFCQYFWLVIQPDFVSAAVGTDPYIPIDVVIQGLTYAQWYAALCG